LEESGIHWLPQLPTHAYGVNLLGENVNIIKRNMKPSLNIGKEFDLGVYGQKTKCIFIFHHHSIVQNRNIKIINDSCEVQTFGNSNKPK
jgi:hypothetical protein